MGLRLELRSILLIVKPYFCCTYFCFSNFSAEPLASNVHSDSVGLGWGLRFCSFDKLWGMLMLLGQDHALSSEALSYCFHGRWEP